MLIIIAFNSIPQDSLKNKFAEAKCPRLYADKKVGEENCLFSSLWLYKNHGDKMAEVEEIVEQTESEVIEKSVNDKLEESVKIFSEKIAELKMENEKIRNDLETLKQIALNKTEESSEEVSEEKSEEKTEDEKIEERILEKTLLN